MARTTDKLRTFSLGVVLLASSACSKEESSAPRASPSSSATSSATVASTLAVLDSPTAFDLVSAPFGAMLVWVGRGEGEPPTLSVLDLNRDAKAEAAPRRMPLDAAPHTRVSDLSAVFAGQSRAITWLEQGGSEARVQTLLIPEVGSPLRLDLGPGWRSPHAARGNIAVAADDADVVVFLRRGRERCADETETDCFGFGFHRVHDGQLGELRVTLSVPVPCDEQAAQLVMGPKRWHYAVCTSSGEKSLVTVFNIQPHPEYASAERVLSGCSPLGTVRLGEQAAIVADCHGRRWVAKLQEEDRPIEVAELGDTAPRCSNGMLVLDGAGTTISLSAPQGDLALLLPDTVAGAGARAVWTGRALLVAEAKDEGLSISRSVCHRGELVRVPNEGTPE